MLKHKFISVMIEPKNMLIRHAIFHCELFPWFIFLAECEIFNCVDVNRRLRHCMDDNLPAISRTA